MKNKVNNRIQDAWCINIARCAEKYPNLDIMQLGNLVITLGVLRSNLGHEDAMGTFRDYIHATGSESQEVADCLDFLEREIFCYNPLKKSKLDIDTYHSAKTTSKIIIS